MYFYPGVAVPAYNLSPQEVGTGGSRVQGLKSVWGLKKSEINKPMKNSVDLKSPGVDLKYHTYMHKHTQQLLQDDRC